MAKSRRAQEEAWNQILKQHIQHNIVLIGAAAWKGYQQYGRGFLVINMTQLVTPPSKKAETIINSPTGVPMAYLPISDVPDIERLPGRSLEMLQQYDPKTGCVAIFLFDSPTSKLLDTPDLSITRFRTVPPPPAAYELLKDDLPDVELPEDFELE